MNAVLVENLFHTYPAKRPSKLEHQALKGISFSVEAGEIYGLLGPNGGGKSTTFHILSTFLASQGRVLIFGDDLSTQPEAVRRNLGVVFQAPGLDKKLTVQENLVHQGHLYGLTGPGLLERIDFVLSRVGLSERQADLVESLSGGLKRRVEVAKGLLHQPKLLLLDEPSTGLDPGARRELWSYLVELRAQEKMTILVTTHLMEEAERCDRVAILDKGKIVAQGKPEDLKREIGGDVITIESPEPEVLARQISERFGVSSLIVDGTLRIERERGHEFVPQIAGAFAGQMTSVTLGKPTLEDVFIKHTGHRLGTL